MDHANLVDNFYNLTLTNDDYFNIAIISFIILCSIGFAAKIFISDIKKLSWVISLLNSFVVSIVGIAYTVKTVYSHFHALSLSTPGAIVFEQQDNIACSVCIWFAVVNVVDLAFGIIFYPSTLTVLTSYLHHPVFTVACLIFLTGNGILFKMTPTPGGFALCCLEEIPTFLLGLGTVFPRFRTDIGFGVTFFIFRIVFHTYFTIHGVLAGIPYFSSIIMSLSMVLHSFWFYSWVTKYGKKFFKSSKSIN